MRYQRDRAWRDQRIARFRSPTYERAVSSPRGLPVAAHVWPHDHRANELHGTSLINALGMSRPNRPPYSRNTTAVALLTICASSVASQLVRRTQPCDSVLPIVSGCAVPRIPYEALVRSIHTEPTGLFGPSAISTFSVALTPLKANFGS